MERALKEGCKTQYSFRFGASVVNVGGRQFEPWPNHTKDLKKLYAASLLDSGHLKRIDYGQTTIG